jgi:hypothetical protein
MPLSHPPALVRRDTLQASFSQFEDTLLFAVSRTSSLAGLAAAACGKACLGTLGLGG